MTAAAWPHPWTPLAKALAAEKDPKPRPRVHRSLFVCGELHLGPLGRCRHCRPYFKEGDAHQ